MDKHLVISTVLWALASLAIILLINLAAIFIVGYWHPTLILIALSTITFFEAGLFSLIGGAILMIGGFPSLSKAIRGTWNREMEKETIRHSYTPLLLAGFLLLVSIISSLFVY